MTEDPTTPAAHAAAIDAARQRLMNFVRQCPDDLNAAHAAGAEGAGELTREKVSTHLRSSGDALIALIALIAGLEPGQLDLDGGRIRRLATVAARHADSHRAEFGADPAAAS